ncbi:histone-lysine N-methyltransferase SUVR2 protein [Trifolium repens]|nr:histone-lysine N-methyltransferase SUVR2 protein [Trifolium repens]
MAPRRKSRKMEGNSRMDAALDAMRQFGFEESLVRETIQKLLDVYDGIQGWPFIEEGSYKLLIESILSAEDRDNARNDDVGETSSSATPATGTTRTTERRKRKSRWDERPDDV